MRIAVLVGLGAALAGIALVHVPAVGRLVPGAEKCPRLAPGPALEDARRQALLSLAGATVSPKGAGEGLFGLAVGTDGREAVKKWAGARSVTCTDVDGLALRCSRTSSVLGFASDVFLRFDTDRLVGLDAIGAAKDAHAPFVALRDSLTKSFGRAHDESELASRWRFADLAVDLSMVPLHDGARVRLQVRSIH